MKQPIWTLGFIVVLVVIGIPALGMSAGAAPKDPEPVENESVSIDTTSWTAVDYEAPEYGDNETVYYNGSTVATSEYEWSTENGSIRAVSGGELDGVSSVSISYNALEHMRMTEIFLTAIRPVIYVIMAMMLVAGIGVALYGLSTMTGGGGGR